MNRDGCVNSLRVMLKVKADDACNAMAWWLPQSDYSIDEDSDNTATLENRSPKTWKLAYR